MELFTFVTGLDVGILVFKNIQEIVGLFSASFSIRKLIDNVVLLWGEGVPMLALCLLYLELDSFVNPTHV